MISILHPEILPVLHKINYGLLPVYVPQEDKFLLVIKANKETLLTARTNNEFKIYLLEDVEKPNRHLGIISAFFDDQEEPLVLLTLLFAKDNLLDDVTKLFSQPEFEIYFFDEHNREFMGFKAINDDYVRFRATIEKAAFDEFNQSEVMELINRLQTRFAIRDVEDNLNAFKITLGERLYPDDYIIMDNTQAFHGYNDSKQSAAITMLERGGDPGPMQERDIALLLVRVFERKNIYLNPFRIDTGRELTDVLVVTDKIMLFIQAKDSPNTEDSLRRNIERKRSVIRSQITEASKQMRGALNHARNNDQIDLKTQDDKISLPTKGKQLVGLIIVREIFDDDYFECSASVLDLAHSLKIPIGLLGYSQLHLLSQRMNTPILFVNALYDIIEKGIKDGVFPKPVWSGPPQN